MREKTCSTGAVESAAETNDKNDPAKPRRLGYADPPYMNQAKRHYSHDPQCAEVDHQALIKQLTTYDGWALSCSTPSLRTLLPLCPPDVRVAAWVKPFCSFKAANPAYAWEPVLYKPCRSRKGRFVVRDWVAVNMTMRKGLCGVKPDRFCYWLFELLAMEPDDKFADLFPGSGAVTRAWRRWKAFELERRETKDPVGLYAQSADLKVFAAKPNRLGFAAGVVGRKGGLAKSVAKANAVRANGALGGRPRRIPPAEPTYSETSFFSARTM
ncbi:MAG: hypothetical protein ACLQAH_05340 [Limisphaerales bacterium]